MFVEPVVATCLDARGRTLIRYLRCLRNHAHPPADFVPRAPHSLGNHSATSRTVYFSVTSSRRRWHSGRGCLCGCGVHVVPSPCYSYVTTTDRTSRLVRGRLSHRPRRCNVMSQGQPLSSGSRTPSCVLATSRVSLPSQNAPVGRARGIFPHRSFCCCLAGSISLTFPVWSCRGACFVLGSVDRRPHCVSKQNKRSEFAMSRRDRRSSRTRGWSLR